MTRRLVLFVVTLTLYLLQVSVLPQILLYRFRLDLLLLWVVAYALLTGPKEGLIFGAVIGLLIDLTVGHPFGLQIFCKALIGYLSGNVANTFFREQLSLPLAIMFMALVAQELMSFAFYRRLLGSGYSVDQNSFGELSLMILYSLVFSALIYRSWVTINAWTERTAYERSESRKRLKRGG